MAKQITVCLILISCCSSIKKRILQKYYIVSSPCGCDFLSYLNSLLLTFPHHRNIPDWLFSRNTSLELREEARAGTSMVLVLDGSEPWTWNSLTGGSGSEVPFLDVPPFKKRTVIFFTVVKKTP